MAIEKSKDEQKSLSQNEETKTPEQEEMVSMSQVEALINARLKESAAVNRDTDLATTVATAVAEAMRGNQPVEKFDDLQYLSQRQMPKDDILAAPVIFWALGILLVIGDDRRNRQSHPAPYGSVVFKPLGEKRIQRGKETEIQIFATYESWSKAEVEWLKGHSLMGSRFYLKEDESLDVNRDLMFANKVAKYAQGMMGTHASQVISQAQAMNIAITENIPQMRIAIAQRKATDEMGQWEESSKVILSGTAKSKLLMTANGAQI